MAKGDQIEIAQAFRAAAKAARLTGRKGSGSLPRHQGERETARRQRQLKAHKAGL